ncbi:MAG: hypothetical protein QNJ72_25855 [Pleurocapsa sp. MO_226.B13]|nr:hypothetical protein [Pleurocapsa sp. MO_226.B13]
MSDAKDAYIYEIGGDLRGILGDVTGGVVTQYIITTESKVDILNRKLIKGSPYMGLNKFESKDRDKFFGREQWIIKLSKDLEQNNLLFLLGASGSGKSSLVRAGLIPHLSDEYGAARLATLIFVPHETPFESLYHKFHQDFPSKYLKEVKEIIDKKEPKTLIKVIDTLKEEWSKWLIFIDQFEELFTITPKLERDKFIASLLPLLKQRDKSIKLIVAMRSDFIDNLRGYPDLTNKVEKQLRLIRDLTEMELRLAIAEPAARNGVIFEKGLVEQIISDFFQQAGSLPLLQYTLNLLWEKDGISENNRILNIKTYQDLGGITGALQKQADYIYKQELNEQEQKAAEQIFIDLIDILDREPISRRVELSRFKDNNLLERTLNKLIDSRLLVSGRYKSIVEESGTQSLELAHVEVPHVEVAHEQLLRSWQFLQDLIQEKKEIIILRSRLIGDANQWYELRKEDEEKAQDELWSGSKLERVLELIDEKAFGSLDEKSEQFIKASVERRDRQKRKQEEQRQRELEQERKARKAAQKTTVITLIAAPMLTLLLIVAGINWRAKQIEEIRNLSESSKALLVSNQAFDTLIESLQAAKKLKQSILPPSELRKQVRGTLQQALIEDVKEYNRIEGRTENITSVRLNPDSKIIATASQDGTVKLWSMDGEELQTLPHKLPDNEVVARVIFSPNDGQTIATVITGANKMDSKRVKLWNMDGEELQTLPYNGFPQQVILSPDGQMVATASKDVTLWNTGGEKLKTFPNGSLSSVSFSPDSKVIAIAHGVDVVTLWSTKGKKLKTLQHRGHLQVSFSPNGQMIASGSIFGNSAKLWSIDGKELQTLPHDDSVFNVSFSPDSQRIVTEDANGVARLWSTDGGESKILAHDKAVTIVRFSPDKQTIATVGKDKIVKLWSHDGQLLRTLTGHQAKIRSLSFSPDGQRIATSSDDKTVKLWSINGQELQTLQHYYPVKYVSFGSDGQTITSVGKDNTVRFWSLKNLEFKTLQGHKQPVHFVRFSPDGQRIATTSYDSTVILWSIDGQKLKTFPDEQGGSYAIDFSPDAQMIASSSHHGIVRLWSIDSKEFKSLKTEKYDAIQSVSFSPDGETIAAGRFDGPVEIWSRDGEKLKILTGHKGMVNSISYSPDSQTIATGSRDRTVKLWSIDGKELKTLKGHNDYVISVSFSPDGQTITSVSRDGAIKLWNSDGEELKTIQYLDVFESVSFSPDGKIIATTSGDNTVQLWSHDGKELETLKGHEDEITSVSFSPDGKTLATASWDNSVILWNLDFDKWESLLDKDLDQLMVDACDVVSDYLKKKPEEDSDRHLCDGIGTQK